MLHRIVSYRIVSYSIVSYSHQPRRQAGHSRRTEWTIGSSGKAPRASNAVMIMQRLIISTTILIIIIISTYVCVYIYIYIYAHRYSVYDRVVLKGAANYAAPLSLYVWLYTREDRKTGRQGRQGVRQQKQQTMKQIKQTTKQNG